LQLSLVKTDAVVIGSGISGLTLAGLLAKNGQQVVIIEENKKPGGALRRFSRAGIPFDIGFHYTGGLDRDQVLRVLWEYLGIWPRIKAVPLHPDGYDLFHFRDSGTEVRAYYSYDQLKDELSSVFPKESGGIKQYLDTIREICQANPFYNLDLPLTPFLRDFFNANDSQLTSTIASMVSNSELQAVLSAPTFLYGVPAAKASMTMHAAVAHGYYSGAWGVNGGGQAIVDAFLKMFAETDVDILTGCRAEKINTSSDNSRIESVTTSAGVIKAKVVIYTGHPAHLPGLVSEGAFRPAFCNRIKDLEDTISMFIVFGRIDPTSVPLLDNANLYSIDPGFENMGNLTKDGVIKGMLMTAPGRRDLEGSDPDRSGAQGVILMRPASWEETARFSKGPGNRCEGYKQWKAEATEDLIKQAAQAFGNSCLDIKPLAAGSPLTFRDELGSPAGGIYGVQHNTDQFVARARTKIPGLYLSGQGSLMTGLLGSSLAGLVTAGEIMGLEETWDRVRNCH